MNRVGGPLSYSADELTLMLHKMDVAASRFYAMAVGIGHHQFIEFAGFMREYIVMCRSALDQGIDFGTTGALPMQPFHASYIGEKFGCIFGETLKREPGLLAAFCAAAFGVPRDEGGTNGSC